MTVIHFTVVSIGLNEQSIIWVDNVLHILAGVVIAMSWFRIIQKTLKTSIENTPTLIIISSTVGFVLFIALFWEIFEFAYWKGVPEWANKFKFYSPTIADALIDMVLDLIGGAVFFLFISRKKR